MGCAPAWPTSAVSPATEELSTTERPQAQGSSPSVPSGTPHQYEPLQGGEEYLASELQKRLLSHVETGKKKGQSSRQQSADDRSKTHDEDEEAKRIEKLKVLFATFDKEAHLFKLKDGIPPGVSRPKPVASVTPVAAVKPVAPVKPVVPIRHVKRSVRMQGPTDSQIEFFKMLDKKIEEGPDYIPEVEKQKTSVSSTKDPDPQPDAENQIDSDTNSNSTTESPDVQPKPGKRRDSNTSNSSANGPDVQLDSGLQMNCEINSTTKDPDVPEAGK